MAIMKLILIRYNLSGLLFFYEYRTIKMNQTYAGDKLYIGENIITVFQKNVFLINYYIVVPTSMSIEKCSIQWHQYK